MRRRKIIYTDKFGKKYELHYPIVFNNTVCSNEHNYIQVVDTSTCIDDGFRMSICRDCHHIDAHNAESQGHTWDSDLCTKPRTCTKCGAIDENHIIQPHYMNFLKTIEPYCEVGGLHIYQCQHCSHQTFTEIPALEHEWSEWTIDKYSTGITDGSKHRECSRCKEIDRVTIPKIESADEYFVYTQLADGTYSIKPIEDIELPSELVIPSEFKGCPVTTIENEAFEAYNKYGIFGNIKSVYIPSSIRYIGDYAFQECYGIEQIIIPKSVTYVGRQAFFDCGATIYCECSESDATEWHSEWSDSDDPNTVEWDYANNPDNETADGIYAGSYLMAVDESATDMTVASGCSSIGVGVVNGWTHMAAIKIPLNVKTILPKAFTNSENLIIYCEADSQPEGWLDGWCDDSVTVVWGYACASGHSWSNWNIVLPAECEIDGMREHTCTRCGEIETEIVKAEGHDWDTEVEIVPPTCTEGGYTIHKCNNCDETYTDTYTEALGHNVIDGICTRCNNGNKGVVYYGVSAIPESYDNAFILGLMNKTPSNTHLPSVTAKPLTGEYIYYCAPTSFGDCAFMFNNFVGGFTLIAEISFTNAGGKTEAYNIYKSNQANLGVNGAITITIKEMG